MSDTEETYICPECGAESDEINACGCADYIEEYDRRNDR